MELARSIVSRLRQYVGDRRHAKRQRVRLPFTLSMASSAKSLHGEKQIRNLGGHTWDLSPNSMALIVSSIRLGDQHLMGENRSLNVKLELPSGPVEMKVTPVRYETFEEQSESGYIIGAKITYMTEEDRARFTDYVSSLVERKR